MFLSQSSKDINDIMSIERPLKIKKIIVLISERIRLLRKKKVLTQEELSLLSGVDYKHIQLLESRRSPAIRIDTLEKLCTGLGVSVREFFNVPPFGVNEPEKPSGRRNYKDRIKKYR